ncbi:MAG: hypothetical protein ACFFA0_10185 [Promethearchaeota archaeon]
MVVPKFNYLMGFIFQISAIIYIVNGINVLGSILLFYLGDIEMLISIRFSRLKEDKLFTLFDSCLSTFYITLHLIVNYVNSVWNLPNLYISELYNSFFILISAVACNRFIFSLSNLGNVKYYWVYFTGLFIQSFAILYLLTGINSWAVLFLFFIGDFEILLVLNSKKFDKKRDLTLPDVLIWGFFLGFYLIFNWVYNTINISVPYPLDLFNIIITIIGIYASIRIIIPLMSFANMGLSIMYFIGLFNQFFSILFIIAEINVGAAIAIFFIGDFELLFVLHSKSLDKRRFFNLLDSYIWAFYLISSHILIYIRFISEIYNILIVVIIIYASIRFFVPLRNLGKNGLYVIYFTGLFNQIFGIFSIVTGFNIWVAVILFGIGDFGLLLVINTKHFDKKKNFCLFDACLWLFYLLFSFITILLNNIYNFIPTISDLIDILFTLFAIYALFRIYIPIQYFEDNGFIAMYFIGFFTQICTIFFLIFEINFWGALLLFFIADFILIYILMYKNFERKRFLSKFDASLWTLYYIFQIVIFYNFIFDLSLPLIANFSNPLILLIIIYASTRLILPFSNLELRVYSVFYFNLFLINLIIAEFSSSFQLSLLFTGWLVLMLIGTCMFCAYLCQELLEKIGPGHCIFVIFLAYAAYRIIPGFDTIANQIESVYRAFFIEFIFIWLSIINYFVIYYKKAKNNEIFFVIILYLTLIVMILILLSI